MALGRKKTTVDARKAGSVESALRRSLRAAVASDWPAAETWLERIVEADSTDLDAYHALARLYREQGAVGRAIRMHQNLLLRSGLGRDEKQEALLELARDFHAGGFSERAAASYEEVLDSAPKNPEALDRLVSLLGETREYPRALALVKRLRRIDREIADEAELALLLAQAQEQIDVGEAEAARATLSRCVKRHKTSGLAWSMLGTLEAERGKDARAITAWKKGVMADPSVAAELYPKIEAGFSARGKAKDFEKFLRSVQESRPEDVSTRIALARVFKSRGEETVALEELARAIEIAPTSGALRVELGRLLLESGQEAEALKAYSALLDVVEDVIGGAGVLGREQTQTSPAEPPERASRPSPPSEEAS